LGELVERSAVIALTIFTGGTVLVLTVDEDQGYDDEGHKIVIDANV